MMPLGGLVLYVLLASRDWNMFCNDAPCNVLVKRRVVSWQYACVAQRIEQARPKGKIGVRFPSRAPTKIT